MTSDFNYDQRMIRIAQSLSDIFDVYIFSKAEKIELNFKHINIFTKAKKGISFYSQYNFQLAKNLLALKPNFIYAADPDTLLAAGLYRKIFNTKLIYDSHEYFVEVPELIGKNNKKYVWNHIENIFGKSSDLNITVNESLAKILSEKIHKPFVVIQNCPSESHINEIGQKEKILIYQGAVNKGRGLECAIDTMKLLDDYVLKIIGDGDIKKDLVKKVKDLKISNVEFIDKLSPHELLKVTRGAKFGLNLLESNSKSYYYSLANKFFDYLHAGVPSINMDFPEYNRILSQHKVGFCIHELDPAELALAIHNYESEGIYQFMVGNCKTAKTVFNWQNESQKLITEIKNLI
jgi:glycosyltransferase involved in cell wall biosynthesis